MEKDREWVLEVWQRWRDKRYLLNTAGSREESKGIHMGYMPLMSLGNEFISYIGKLRNLFLTNEENETQNN